MQNIKQNFVFLIFSITATRFNSIAPQLPNYLTCRSDRQFETDSLFGRSPITFPTHSQLHRCSLAAISNQFQFKQHAVRLFVARFTILSTRRVFVFFFVLLNFSLLCCVSVSDCVCVCVCVCVYWGAPAASFASSSHPTYTKSPSRNLCASIAHGLKYEEKQPTSTPKIRYQRRTVTQVTRIWPV